jgi:hypothetical protein
MQNNTKYSVMFPLSGDATVLQWSDLPTFLRICFISPWICMILTRVFYSFQYMSIKKLYSDSEQGFSFKIHSHQFIHPQNRTQNLLLHFGPGLSWLAEWELYQQIWRLQPNILFKIWNYLIIKWYHIWGKPSSILTFTLCRCFGFTLWLSGWEFLIFYLLPLCALCL